MGTAEIAQEYGLTHFPNIACNEYGTPLLNSMVSWVDQRASNSIIVYANVDVVFNNSLIVAINRAVENQERRRRRNFVIIGQTLDVRVDYEIAFERSNWEANLIDSANHRGNLRVGRDYFVYARGFWGEMPAFAVARPAWDKWAIFRALELGADVIDATDVILAIHQNHQFVTDLEDSVYKNRWNGPEAEQNRHLAGDWARRFGTEDANWKMGDKKIAPVISRRRFIKLIQKCFAKEPGMIRVLGYLGKLLYPERFFPFFDRGNKNKRYFSPEKTKQAS